MAGRGRGKRSAPNCSRRRCFLWAPRRRSSHLIRHVAQHEGRELLWFTQAARPQGFERRDQHLLRQVVCGRSSLKWRKRIEPHCGAIRRNNSASASRSLPEAICRTSPDIFHFCFDPHICVTAGLSLHIPGYELDGNRQRSPLPDRLTGGQDVMVGSYKAAPDIEVLRRASRSRATGWSRSMRSSSRARSPSWSTREP